MAWDLNYRGYYRGTGMNRMWYLRQGSFLGVLFCTERGLTQRDPVFLAIFNIVVDTVVRAVLL